ncbi:MAG: hypothetical protein OZSIB_2015 [Candidatus Ozemobacter sibiricus]|jgi:radical SAM-linked protein|uniref:DUF2344 domain-containing protein n=1 Tax=Candidatus Ozemobacter sibiricus TaxID=2268124 RepID=A0A367ZIF7_9BACT|nr:MAG: hypothetical protein OZSIB_2015 [Candidatus Ozemobacter sibiricus]
MSDTPFVLELTYARSGPAIYLSHLDAIDVLSRAIRRTGLPYRITQGCHPRPRLTFGPPLPLGHASRCEFLRLHLERPVDPAEAAQALSRQLPAGFTVLEARPVEGQPALTGSRLRYRLVFREGAEDTCQTVARFLGDPSQTILVRRDGKEERVGIGPAIIAVAPDQGASTPTLLVDFEQGKQGLPSAGKILTAVVEALGDRREDLILIERIALFS